MTTEERLARLEKIVLGDPTLTDEDPGLVPRIVSLERDRSLMRWALGGLMGLGAAIIQQWAQHFKGVGH